MAMGIGKQALASLTGNIETAVLVIHDYRERAKQLKAGGMDSTEAQLFLSQRRTAGTVAALEAGAPPVYPSSLDRILNVQFNPSELTLNASAVPKKQEDSTSDKSRTMAVEDPKLNLTTTLYFDDMDTYDAFMWDKFTLGLSAQTAANIGKGVLDAKGQAPIRSVQGQVESLVAALRNPFTRLITFRWADFCFVGQLNTVRANYTMFSTSGRPIRAAVLLRIQHELDPVMLNGWYDDFDKVFGNDVDGQPRISNLVNPEQTSANLLNMVL